MGKHLETSSSRTYRSKCMNNAIHLVDKSRYVHLVLALTLTRGRLVVSSSVVMPRGWAVLVLQALSLLQLADSFISDTTQTPGAFWRAKATGSVCGIVRSSTDFAIPLGNVSSWENFHRPCCLSHDVSICINGSI